MIKKRYSEKHKRYLWGFDARISDGAGPKRLRVYKFDTKDEAEEALGAFRRAEKEGKFGLAPAINRPTLQELIERRLPTIAAKAERTRARRVLYCWLALLSPRVKVDEIDTPRIRVYVEKRRADGQAPASINRELNIIAATLHAAEEFFSELAQWKAPRIPRPKATKSRRERLISNDEYERLVGYLRRPADEADGRRVQDQRNAYRARVRVAQILQFAMMTAARHGEIVGLKWSDVDYERGRVLIYQTKTDDYKEIPLYGALMALIDERKPATGRFVFSRGGNNYPKFYRILREACNALKIPYGKDAENGLVLHAARHTVTTRLIESGLDLDTIGMITGHRAKELIAHYGHKHPGSVARAAAALEEMAKNGQSVGKKENGNSG